MTKLPVLCPQEYSASPVGMRVTTCSRCPTGWNKTAHRCEISTGAEALPITQSIPDCPIAHRCQHQLQSSEPCTVRARGFVCESALLFAGLSEAEIEQRTDAFNADYLA